MNLRKQVRDENNWIENYQCKRAAKNYDKKSKQ